MKQFQSQFYVFIFGFLFIGLVFLHSKIDDSNNLPIPTEIIQKKKDRKLFKKERQAWMDNMHRTAPDIDWKKIDDETRQIRISQKTDIRKRLQTQNGYHAISIRQFNPNPYEIFLANGLNAVVIT